MISAKQLNKIKESMILAMKQNFRNSGELATVALIFDKRGNIHPFLTPFGDQEDKKAWIIKLRGICQEKQAVAIMQIGEAYSKDYDSREEEKIIDEAKQKGGIKNMEGSKEVVLINYETYLFSENITYDIDRENRRLYNETSGKTTGGIFGDILCRLN